MNAKQDNLITVLDAGSSKICVLVAELQDGVLRYRGHGIEGTEVYIAGQKRGITRALRRALKRRNAIEPIIGHTKHDGLMGRNDLKGTCGDAMNAILAAAGHNPRIILRKLRLFWLCCRRALLPDLCLTVPAISLA